MGAGELGGRCCTCSEWGRRARIAFLMSNRSRLGRSDGSATITPASLYHHSHQRLSGDYNAFCVTAAAQGGDELVWSVRQKPPPGVSLGELRTFHDFLLSVVLRWDAGRPWHVGPRRYCASAAVSPGSGGLVLRRGCSTSSPLPASVRLCAELRGAGREALKGIAQFSGKQRQWS